MLIRGRQWLDCVVALRNLDRFPRIPDTRIGILARIAQLAEQLICNVCTWTEKSVQWRWLKRGNPLCLDMRQNGNPVLVPQH